MNWYWCYFQTPAMANHAAWITRVVCSPTHVLSTTLFSVGQGMDVDVVNPSTSAAP